MKVKYKLMNYEFWHIDPEDEDYEERVVEEPEESAFEKVNLIENKPVCGKYKIITGGE